VIHPFRAIQMLAAAEVVAESGRKSPEYHIRRIMRAYSERFHTPLHVVETLSLADVLQHYYESDYEERWRGDTPTQEEMKTEIRILTMTDAEFSAYRASLDHRESDDAAFWESSRDAEEKLFEKVPEEIRGEEPPAPPAPPEKSPGDLSVEYDDPD
jgi:hypothetical protein